jgi:amino acid transporter
MSRLKYRTLGGAASLPAEPEPDGRAGATTRTDGTRPRTPLRTPSAAYLVKRLLLGRPLATSRLEHERLGKPVALAVFSSDNLSSVAYASEEILRVLIPAVGVAAFSLVFPISFVIVLIEAILIFSYRQTIKAYPSAGGAYIVTKDNLGLLPAQLAGVALLVDYVLTVSVSTAAGVQAISSVVPLSVVVRVGLSLVFVWIIAYGNLLGVRESGRIFAMPTYVFIASLGLTCVAGLYGVITGHTQTVSTEVQVQHGALPLGTGAVALFIFLRAFASGGAAVTGVEAISNGVPAFRKPEWRNAQITLGWMGAILGSTFLAVSYIAHRLQIVPVADESKSVLAQIGEAVYGHGVLGHSLFLLLQISTTLILILAANTSFADFPRLASFHAGDMFMPKQLTKRGHRLVFSNGILGLALAASGVIVLFGASVTNMIPLYALGVFTSFTLSQTGMARRHLRLREPRWRFGLLVNGVGAVSTFVVAVIIAVVKFKPPGEFGGAWMVILAVPILVAILVRVNRTYEREEKDLLTGMESVTAPEARRNVVVALVQKLDPKTLHALQYALTIRPHEVRALNLYDRPEEAAALAEGWSECRLHVPLDQVRGSVHDLARILKSYLIERAPTDAVVTVVVPGPARSTLLQRLRRGRTWSGLYAQLRELDNVNLVVVRDHGGQGHARNGLGVTVVPRPRHIALIAVGRLDRSVLKAIRYARAIDALEIRAVHAAVDPDHATRLAEQWGETGQILGIPLDIVECFDRNIPRTIVNYIERWRRDDAEVSILLPRREYPRLLQRLLHDRTSRAISRAVAYEAHVDVVAVPYRMGTAPETVEAGGRGDGSRPTSEAAGVGPALPLPRVRSLLRPRR